MRISFLMFCLFLSGAAFGADAGVGNRMTCADIQSRISELGAVAEPDEATTDEITKLKADYRRNCVRAAGARRTTASNRVVVETVVESESVEDVAGETVSEVEQVVETSAEPAPAPEKTEAEIIAEQQALLDQELANLDAGLCADGSAPNKFGCCGDEIFKDLGDTVFACCPVTGGDCFPPIK